MDWDDMRIFLSVAREESLSGAARLLRLDPATVGRRIRRLEEAAGAVLFVKSPQGYILTGAGDRFLEYAEAAEQSMVAALEDARGQAQSLSGTIRLGAPDGCATYLLPQVTRRLAAKNPGLDIQVVALPRVFNLSKREADMAITVSRPTAGRLVVQKVAEYGLHMAAAKSYLERAPEISGRTDLQHHPIVGYIPDMIFDRELDYLAEFGLNRVDLASNLVTVQVNWLRSGAGIGIVHDFAMPDAPELQFILPDAVTLQRTFWLVRHADDRRNDRLARFATALVDELRKEIARREA